MSVIRVVKSDNFTILINDTLRDERLSLEATGLLVRLLSRPSDWMVRFESLRRESRVGRDKLRRIIGELADAGYLVRRRIRQRNGKFIWLTDVHEAVQTSVGKSVTGSSTSDSKTVDGKQGGIQRNKKQRKTTTRGGRRDDLVWPVSMSKAEIRSASKMLFRVGRDAQAIVDVLQAAITAGDIKKSRLAYLNALVARHEKGTFDPTPGLPVEEARRRRRVWKAGNEKVTTEAVLRQHARLLQVDEDGYLSRCKAAKRPVITPHGVIGGGASAQGGRP